MIQIWTYYGTLSIEDRTYWRAWHYGDLVVLKKGTHPIYTNIGDSDGR